MVNMENIETGVDKLVKLVAREKKIELGAAAKQLGVEPAVVQEWSDFLEQEGLVELQYSFAKTFIVEKRLSASDVEKKGKEYENKKEAFIRKVDSTLRQLEQETADFESIKGQYYTLKGQIGDEIDAVKDEIEQLRHYEELKKTIDQDILKQKVEYQKTLDEIHQRISNEERRFNKIIEEIKSETSAVNNEKSEFVDIKREESDILKRIGALQEILRTVTTRVQTQDQSARLHEERLQRLRELANSLQKDLAEKKEKEREPLLRISADQEQRIRRIQDDIMKKIKERRDNVQVFQGQSQDILDRFEQFFDKRARTEETIKAMEKAKLEMKDELGDLIKKAKAFDLTVKGADATSHVKELEAKFKDFDKKKSAFTGKLDDLKNIIMGKETKHAPEPATTNAKGSAPKAKKASPRTAKPKKSAVKKKKS
jgi:chromosome segregation ATPase